jgi:hypothetical protein
VDGAQTEKKDGIPVQNRISKAKILKPAANDWPMILLKREVLLDRGSRINSPK